MMSGRRLALFVVSFAIAVLAAQLWMTPVRADEKAPAPPGLDSSYYAKDKDQKPTKTIRSVKRECQKERDALQEAVENWYQFQADEAQAALDKENKKPKPDPKVVTKFNQIQTDAKQGAKKNPNAPKKKSDLINDIAKLKKALDDCEKEKHTAGFSEALEGGDKAIDDWIANLWVKRPTCSDDKIKLKEEVRQMLKDATKAAESIKQADLKKDAESYLKNMKDFLDKGIDELPRCTVEHTKGFDDLPKEVKTGEDVKKIVNWITSLVLPPCADDKKKTKQVVEQMLKDAEDALQRVRDSAGEYGDRGPSTKQDITKMGEAIENIRKYLEKINDSCKDKEGGGGGGQKKEDKHPKRSERTRTGLFSQRTITEQPGTETVSLMIVIDNRAWCTYGDANATPVYVTDEVGNPVVVAYTTPPAEISTVDESSRTEHTTQPAEVAKRPAIAIESPPGPTPEQPTPKEPTTAGGGSAEQLPKGPSREEAKPKQPTTAKGPPPEQVQPTTPEQPPREPTTPERPLTQPTTPEQPPKVPTTAEGPPPKQPIEPTTPPQVPEQPPKEPTTPVTELQATQPPEIPTIYDKINFKVRQKVLEKLLQPGQEPPPEKSQVVKLIPQETQEPPSGTKRTEHADNDPTGFNKDPVQCVTGTDGSCPIQIPMEDRGLFGLPGTGTQPSRSYNLVFDRKQGSGGVAETTGNPRKSLQAPQLDGAAVVQHEFAIGNRTYVRITYQRSYGVDRDLSQPFREAYGSKYEEDSCRDKEPGPPAGMQPKDLISLNHELPEASLRLRGTMPKSRAAR